MLDESAALVGYELCLPVPRQDSSIQAIRSTLEAKHGQHSISGRVILSSLRSRVGKIRPQTTIDVCIRDVGVSIA